MKLTKVERKWFEDNCPTMKQILEHWDNPITEKALKEDGIYKIAVILKDLGDIISKIGKK